MSKVKKVFMLLLITITTILILIIISSRFIYNCTNSLKVGFYIKSNKEIMRNDIIAFCPQYNEFSKFAEDKGYWNNIPKECEFTPILIKRVVGLPNDIIVVDFSKVSINGVIIQNSKPVDKILSDKIFSNYQKQIQLKNNEYFVMGDNPLSYDSRYFGAISKEQIKTVLKPFITEEE